MKPVYHYACVAALVIVAYFFVLSPILSIFHPAGAAGVAAPTTVTKIAQTIATVAKSTALQAALTGQNVQLSAAQTTVSKAISGVTGASAQLAGAFAAGLTKPAPTQEVITASSTVVAKASPPPAAATDDQIKRDLKEVLAETTLKTDVATTVAVTYAPKPYSPVFAAYSSDGASGAGITVRKAGPFNLDLLALIRKSTIEPGAGADYIIKGTSASIGVAALYDTAAHSVRPAVIAGIRF